jgi:hypothetical protein
MKKRRKMTTPGRGVMMIRTMVSAGKSREVGSLRARQQCRHRHTALHCLLGSQYEQQLALLKQERPRVKEQQRCHCLRHE